MPSVYPGSEVTLPATAMGTRPKWLEWQSSGNAGGTANLPSGHRRAVVRQGDSRQSVDYYVVPISTQGTEAQWQATIFAPNGSHIFADGLKGIPTIGTPTVRLSPDAPSKAVLQIPVGYGARNIMSDTFAGWSDGHAEKVDRGMELTVEFRRPDGTMAQVFRGMIYQVDSGETVTITAYDRLMDLYQFSDQYQSTQGRKEQTLNRVSITTLYYRYIAGAEPGLIMRAITTSTIRIDPLNAMDQQLNLGIYSTSYGGWSWMYKLSDLTVSSPPAQGERIKKLRTKIWRSSNKRMRVSFYIAHKDDTGTYDLDWDKITEITVAGSGVQIIEADTDYTISRDLSELYIILNIDVDYNSTSTSQGVYVGSTKFNTIRAYYYLQGSPSALLRAWNYRQSPWGSEFPELSIDFDRDHIIPNNSIVINGNEIGVPVSSVPLPAEAYEYSNDPAYKLDVDYQIASATELLTVATELVTAAGLTPDLAAGASIGATTFYQTSTYDYLTCIQEILRGGNYGIRASITEPGKAEIYPRNTIDDTPAAELTTAPDGTGERKVVSHQLTAHWMAEKATQAMVAENATSSGLPIALETDDALLDGSLVKALQTPLRGMTADSTMGTHLLMAVSAGGKVNQLHTNIIEGTMVLAGYRTDIWNLSGDRVGGKPVTITVPEYGAHGIAVPTEIELGNGCTRVSLDNIRGADRSEQARSMGLTQDAISNNASQIPATAYIFARFDDYATEQSGVTPGTVTSVEFIADGGSVLATQNDTNYIRTVEDAVGYLHICAVLPASVTGYAANTPVTQVRFTMDGTARTAVLDNPKYALAGQAMHADIRVRRSA